MTEQQSNNFPWFDAHSREDFLILKLIELNLKSVLDYVVSYNSPNTNGNRMLGMMHYHSTEHMKQVTAIALALLEKESKYPWQWDNGALPLAVACLFHDMNHSLGKFDDAYNVLNAQQAFTKYLEDFCNDQRIHEHKEIILGLIGITQFPYTKEREPKNLIERCIRDADILYGMQDDAIDLVMFALCTEVNRDAIQYTPEQWANGRIDFLLTVDMYTTMGREILDWQLAVANDHNHQSKISTWLKENLMFAVIPARNLETGDVVYIDSSCDLFSKRHMLERLEDTGEYLNLHLDDATTLALLRGESCIRISRRK